MKPTLLRWARERAGLSAADLAPRFPKLDLWEREEEKPTLKQVERFAKATYTPVGYFFLPTAPSEDLPLPDFRTVAGRNLARPTANLLDTIYVCQQRQAWYQEYARSIGVTSHTFVGSADLADDIETVAGRMRDTLRFEVDARAALSTWTEALRQFIAQADTIGVLVMCSGVVLNNNRRALDPEEFRGFALADKIAPLVFINGADSKAAQMFTLAHELAHLWLGQSALSDADASRVPGHDVERWCNRVAAELLVPLDVLREELRRGESLDSQISRLALRFKVSTLVVLRRLSDAGRLTRAELREAYDAELERLTPRMKSSGGDFYLTQAARVSKRFARTLVSSTLEGQTLYRDAMRLLGISKVKTFHELGESLKFTP